MDQSTSAAPLSLPLKRRRHWRRRLALVLLFIALVIGTGIFVLLWTASSDLDDIIAETDRLDPGWRLDEIEAGRKRMPDAENSALQILAVGGGGVYTRGMEKMFDNLPPQVQLNDQQAAYLQKRFEILQRAVTLARKLKDMPDGRFPTQPGTDYFSAVGASLPNIQRAREVADLLQWDAMRRVHSSDAEGAMKSCLAIQHVARSMGDEPMFISQLVRYACNAIAVMAMERTLAQGHFTEASDATLKRVQAALAKESREPTLLIGLRGERAGSHQFFQALGQGKASAKSLINTRRSVPVATTVEAAIIDHLPGYHVRHHAALLRYLNKVVEAAKLPSEEWEERFQVLDKEILGASNLVRSLVPAVKKVTEAERRTRSYLRCAVAALAAERFRLAQNRWPESLDVLVKAGFLDAVPGDPYDGKPLRLKRIAHGLVVYSVGPDRIDNGGAIDRDRPMDPGTDLGFRLWDPRYRRQAPNPPVVERDNSSDS